MFWRFEQGIRAYEICDDAGLLYYLVHTDFDEDEWRDLRAKHKDIIDFSHGTRKVSEIWCLDL